MKQVNRIFIILLWIEKTNLELGLEQVEEASDLPDFTIRILMNHLGPIRKMSVMFSEHFLEETRAIRDVDIPVVLNAEEVPVLQGLDIRQPSEVVFIMEKPINVSKYLNGSLWTSETVFVLVLVESSEDLMEIFRIFWSANAVNVFIFTGAPRKGVSVYTYDPYPYSRCDDIDIRMLKVEEDGFSLKNEPVDLHGCLLNASVVDLPPVAIFPNPESRNGTLQLGGIEVGIVKEVERKLNFVTRFAVARDGGAWGWIHPSPNGVAGEVFLRKSQFGFGLLATTLERYECLDMTAPVSPLRECITWAVPVGAGKSQAFWMEIFVNEFTPTTWVSLGVVFVIVSFIFWRISKLFKPSDFEEVFIFLYSSFIFVPVKTPNVTPLRSLFLTWVWSGFIVMISYQSLMGSKLTVPLRQRDIETIRDLLDSNLRFTGFYNTFRLITYAAEGDLKKVEKRLEPTTYGIKEAIMYIVFDRNIAYLRETTSFKYFSIINPQAKGKVHFMKECAYQYYPIMVLQRKSPLTRRTNEVIGRLFESGILMKWRQKYIYVVAQPPPPVVKLSLSHMVMPFVTLLVGIVTSFIAFVVELLFHCLYKRTEQEVKS